ncbi:MAG TPA: hypothetical protein VNH17_23000 [Streptosporangiaceae bacterium]|nr:hypothetical protein [Streptosporangiaceae bacterium]
MLHTSGDVVGVTAVEGRGGLDGGAVDDEVRRAVRADRELDHRDAQRARRGDRGLRAGS